MKKLVVPIVNRTNYSKIKPVLLLLKDRIKIHIILSSSILLEQYGYPYKDVINDNLGEISYSDCLLASDTPESMNKTISISLIEHTNLYKIICPDAVLATGDRFDMLPTVLSAKVMNIPIFHIQGGELSGSIDNTIRSLISICSDRHYVSTEIALAAVRKLTNSKYIFNFGCPAVEYIQNISIGKFLNVHFFCKKYKDPIAIKPYEDYILILVHPNTTANDIDMEVIIKSILEVDMKRVLLYPNNDAFHNIIIQSIRHYRKDFILIKHMPLKDFVKLMAHAKCMVGNSSAGIREAASFGTPVVNIGTRQQNRERNGNVIDTSCNYEEIKKAILKSIKANHPKENLYFRKNSSILIANDIIENI